MRPVNGSTTLGSLTPGSPALGLLTPRPSASGSRILGSLTPGSLILRLLLPVLLAAPTVRAQPTDPPTPTELFGRAYRLYGEREFEDAATAFRSTRDRHPDAPQTPDALFYEAQAALAQGRAGRALTLFAAFERRYPSHPLAPSARLGVGRYLFERDSFARAQDAFERIADETTSSETAARALVWAAESALRQNDDEGALALYRRAVADHPGASVAPGALYAQAFHLIRLERQEEAARVLADLETRYPTAPQSRDLPLAYGEVYFALEDWDRLVDAVAPRVDALDGPARERATFLLAEGYTHLGRRAEAATAYRAVIDGYPAGAYVRPSQYGLAWNAFAGGDYREAAEGFALVRGETRDSLAARAAYHEAVALKLGGDRAGAAEGFGRAAEGWPGSPFAEHGLFERGVLFYEAEEWRAADEAFAAFFAAFDASPLAGEAYVLAANARLANGDVGGAERYFDRAAALTGSAEARDALAYQRASLLYSADAFDRAYETFARLAEGAESADVRADALFWAAESAFSKGDAPTAVTLADRYRTRHARGRFRDAAAYVKAWGLFRQTKYDEAATAFEAFIDDLDATDATRRYRDEAHLRLGDAYIARRRYAEAANAYARAGNEGRDYSLYGTGQAYDLAGQPDRAQRAWERLLREFPNSPWREEARYSLGYVEFKADRFDAAITQYETLLRDYPDDPLAAKAQYAIGDAHFNAGRFAPAAAAYARVLERYPESPFAAEAASSLQNASSEAGTPEAARETVDAFARTANPAVADELRFRQAEARYAAGELDAAREAFRAYADRGANADLRVEATYYLAEIAAARGDRGEAARTYRRVLDGPAHPRQGDAALRLGDLLLETGNSAGEREANARGALDAYRRLEALAEGDQGAIADARVGQSRALLALGQPDEAAALADPLAATVPAAALALGRAREAQNRAADALAAYRTAVRDDAETGAEAAFRLGALLLATDDARGALAAVAAVETRFAGYDAFVPQALLVRARAQAALGNADEARATYEALEADFAGTEYARTAARERAALGG